MATDYWFSKLCYDLQRPGAGAEFRADREKVLARYPLSPAVLTAIRSDDVATLAPLVNAYLLRFYFGAAGMNDETFVAKLHAMQKEAAHG
jgi:hypothetical protein